jgi:hypothetical protein
VASKRSAITASARDDRPVVRLLQDDADHTEKLRRTDSADLDRLAFAQGLERRLS